DGVELIVIAVLTVADQVGILVSQSEDHIAGASHVGVLNVDHLSHIVSIGGHSYHSVGNVALDIGDVLDAGVDVEVIAVHVLALVGHDEHGVAVGSVVLAAGSIKAGHTVVDLQLIAAYALGAIGTGDVVRIFGRIVLINIAEA